MTCKKCNKSFSRRMIIGGKQRDLHNRKYCVECVPFGIYNKADYTPPNKCQNCGKDTINPKFCSRSCAAVINNLTIPKRKPEHHCKRCNKLVTCKKRYCSDCPPLPRNNKKECWNAYKTLQDVVEAKVYFGENKWAYVRSHCRAQYAEELKTAGCVICGYAKHVQACHIRPIRDFPVSAKLSEVNGRDNIVFLCPNHHWEFDHNLLSPQDKETITSN